MISDARGSHVSPGIYTEERDVTYSVKSLGITNLGLVGETLYGPAFQNIEIEDWTSFVDYFGGTSTEKFKGTGLPKYELPYIAKSYLEKSKQLNVVRVLGLSGYHAGPGWILTTTSSGDCGPLPLVVFRSKMAYGHASDNPSDYCSETEDTPLPVVKNIEWIEYTPAGYQSECATDNNNPSAETLNSKYKFGIKVTVNDYFTDDYNSIYIYNLSLNKQDGDYIYKILSSSPETGTTPVYIESVYESSLIACEGLDVASGASAIVNLCQGESAANVNVTRGRFYVGKKEDCIMYIDDIIDCKGECTEIQKYVDKWQQEHPGEEITIQNLDSFTEEQFKKIVTDLERNKVVDLEEYGIDCNTDILFVRYFDIDTSYITCPDYDDYLDAYRPAQTPWFVSEAYASVSGTGENEVTTVTMKKLFKFFTISDGNSSNYQVKVSIQRLNPKLGTFDVLVRDFNDTDKNPLVLEKFSNCTLNRGEDSYLPFKIGSFDGGFVAKSKYITVMMADDEDIYGNIPCGFLGYPMPSYNCSGKVFVDYNTTFNPKERVRSQFFGLNEKNIDTDILKYKGHYVYDNETFDDNPESTTDGFHMDSILSKATSGTVYVNGYSGYNFVTVSTEKVSSDPMIPRIINASYMDKTIYKDEKVRKFTCYFYGGFDGWDVNRLSRTNTDEYKATAYNVSGSVVFNNFEKVEINNENIDLPNTAITSDYYAYLAGYRIFANPQDIDINLFATPGIDWYNNGLLTKDVIDIIEDPEDGRGGDALYVMTSPNDSDVDELTRNFVDSDINTSYACTYYPWVMYYDKSNKTYLNLPVTKDVVRNMAETDNNDAPWYAPAGLLRGTVDCIKADMKTTLQTEDELYLHSINPVKTFSKDGVKVWGNKTAYMVDSPLNRINVRRLMIRVKKLVTDAARNLIFEQYTDTLERQFKGLVEPILAEVKSKRGIYDYRIKTESTPETRDQHILPAKILIKPTSALEYISISFVVYPESVEFDEN